MHEILTMGLHFVNRLIHTYVIQQLRLCEALKLELLDNPCTLIGIYGPGY